MARRPIFVPLLHQNRFVLERFVDFKWHAGLSVAQKQRSIRELHEMARREYGISNPVEVSSKSEVQIGRSLSSFNLKFMTKSGRILTVESAFQASKVFEYGGPYRDIEDMLPIDAKRDPRLRESGNLVGFRFFKDEWPLEPKTCFYDWLYINALLQNPDIAIEAVNYDCFTDIEFNPDKSINCQARSVALYCSLYHSDMLDFYLKSKEAFISLYDGRVSKPMGGAANT